MLAVSVRDLSVWAAIGIALVAYTALVITGTWTARLAGLLTQDAPGVAVVGVGLSFGALLAASWGAAIISGGQSSLTPIALGLGVGLILLRLRGRASRDDAATFVGSPWAIPRRAATLGAIALVGIGLLLAAALAPSPRDGLQPIDSMDAAFYAVVGRDLAASGVETWASPSGFDSLPGLPRQMWYHWGELWLAGVVGQVSGTPPMLARHVVVLPILLVACMALLAGLARAAFPSSMRPHGPIFLGTASCLFLSPIPSSATYFSSWPVGLLLGITSYGLAAAVSFLVAYLAVTDRLHASSMGQLLVVATLAASLIPLHVLIAVICACALATALVLSIVATGTRRRWGPATERQRVAAAAGAASLAAAGWGFATGHGLPAIPVSETVPAFNEHWRSSVAALAVGSVGFAVVPVAAVDLWSKKPAVALVLAGTTVAIAGGALAWGATYASFNSFHLFFGAVAVVGVPASLVAVGHLWGRIPRTARLALATAIGAQLALGGAVTLARLASTTPTDYEPVPVAILEEIERLEPSAKVAYECRPLEEMSTWLPRLVGLDAQTGRRVVPLCFRAYSLAAMLGQPLDAQVVDPAFSIAPQAELFRTAGARPSERELLAFLRDHGVGYVFVDARHPNQLLPSAVPVFTSGSAQLLRLP